MASLKDRRIREWAITVSLIPFMGIGCTQAYEVQFRRTPIVECRPVVGLVQPQEAFDLRWKWESGPSPEYNQNMATPMVADINGDGISDLIFSTFTGGAYNSAGILRVVSGADGREIWSTASQPETNQPLGSTAPAVYDLNRDGRPEILIAGTGTLLVYGSTGTLIDRLALDATPSPQSRIGVADIDSDGIYEVLIGGPAPAGLYRYDVRAHSISGVLLSGVLGMMDVDPDSPGMEIITSTAIHTSKMVKLRDLAFPVAEHSGALIAFGNFDKDPDVEIVVRHGPGINISIFKGKTGNPLQTWTETQADAEACKTRTNRGLASTGALNVGDFDGDGIPDITFAGTCWFRGLKSDTSGLHMLWQVETRDFSSSVTGSSVFDFNGDGRVEVLYNDELYFRIIDGRTGEVLYKLRNDNGTLWENPVVVSLRAGEPASIVLSANSYTHYTQNDDSLATEDPTHGIANVTGIRVIQGGDNRWMPTRTIWNQFDYVVTNVLDNLQIPNSILDFVGLSNRTRANIPQIVERCE